MSRGPDLDEGPDGLWTRGAHTHARSAQRPAVGSSVSSTTRTAWGVPPCAASARSGSLMTLSDRPAHDAALVANNSAIRWWVDERGVVRGGDTVGKRRGSHPRFSRRGAPSRHGGARAPLGGTGFRMPRARSRRAASGHQRRPRSASEVCWFCPTTMWSISLMSTMASASASLRGRRTSMSLGSEKPVG